MCNVDRLKFLQTSIPLLERFADVWQEISKCIDPLHLRNHRRSECKELYSPDKVKEDIPDANLMIAEQTFCWMGTFKKIFNLYFIDSLKIETVTQNIAIKLANILSYHRQRSVKVQIKLNWCGQF